VTLRRRIAPVALLALIGAAPPASDLTVAATCTLGQAPTEAALRLLPLASTEDDSEADERGTIFSFDPAGATVWDAPVSKAQLFDYAIPREREFTQRFEIGFGGDYAAARDALFAAHAKTKCDREIGGAGARSCEMILAPDSGWRRAVTVSESGGGLMLACAFAKDG
jgi:hypothetical protein